MRTFLQDIRYASFPHEADFHVNLPVLLFSVGLAVLTGVLFGLRARGRRISILFRAFSELALVLATVGLYSVVAYSIAQRINEFGARKADVLKIVLASAGVSVGLGIAIGLAFSFGLSRFIAQWTENTRHNPLLVLAGSALLLVVAIMACLAPARGASSVDPMTALRCE